MPKPAPFSFRTNPLRVAGQGVQEQIAREYDGAIETVALIALMLGLIANEWIHHLFATTPSPWTVTVMGLGVIGVFAFRLGSKRQQLQRLAFGRDGERIAAEYLDRLREKKFRVFHDVIADRFNIDHVLVGPAGVFAVETKAKAKQKGEEMVFDGERCSVGRRPVLGEPIMQAKRNAKWLHEFLRKATGRSYFVMPVLTFPQWYIKRLKDVDDIRVLSPAELYCLAKQPRVLNEDEIDSIAFQMEQLIRGSQKTN